MTNNTKKINKNQAIVDETNLQDCRDMWISVFNDPESYLDFYFRHKAIGDYHVFTRRDKGELVSMLHLDAYRLFHNFLLPKKGQAQQLALARNASHFLLACHHFLSNFLFHKNEREAYPVTASHPIPAHYIVGVATEPSYRHQGFMASLLKDAFSFLWEKGEAFTYLMPASAAIYEPFDFRFIYTQKQWEGSCSSFLQPPFSSLSLCPFSSLEQQEKDAVIAFANTMLSSRFQLFAWRDEAYYEAAQAEAEVCGGNLLAAFTENRCPVGLLTFMTDDGKIDITEGIYEDNYAMSVLQCFLSQLKKSAQNNMDTLHFTETAFLPSDIKESLHKEHAFTDENCIMARVISFPAFASLLRSEVPEKKVVFLEDNFIKENNGLWELEICGASAVCRKLPDIEKAIPEENVISLGIADVFSYFLPNLKVFLNEFV